MNNDMLNILGLYYDSVEEALLEKAKQQRVVELQIIAQYIGMSRDLVSYPEYKYVFVMGKGGARKEAGDLAVFINDFNEHFMLCLERRNSASIKAQERFDVICNGKSFTLYSMDVPTALKAIIQHYTATQTNFPLNYQLNLTITKTANPDFIKEYCAVNRSGFFRYWSPDTISVKETAQKILKPIATTYSSYKTVRPHRFEGVLYDNIYNSQKEIAVFAIEYLFGVTLSKSANFKEIGAKLIELGYNDFGLKDVQQLIQMTKCFSRYNNNIKDVYNHLLGVLPPKTDLKRWQKQLKDVQ